MTATPPGPATGRDPIALALLFGGILLALVVAFALPALHVRDADKTLLGVSAWEAAPFLTLVKIVFLGFAGVAAFMPRFAELRLPLTLGAAFMMFLPGLGALVAALNPWTSLRAELVQLSRVNAPWVDPGWGFIALIVAALMLMGAASRARRTEAEDG